MNEELFYPSPEKLYQSAGIKMWDVEGKINLLEKVVAELAPKVVVLRKKNKSDYRQCLERVYQQLRYTRPDLPVIR